jgi:hypothetical protein
MPCGHKKLLTNRDTRHFQYHITKAVCHEFKTIREVEGAHVCSTQLMSNGSAIKLEAFDKDESEFVQAKIVKKFWTRK